VCRFQADLSFAGNRLPIHLPTIFEEEEETPPPQPIFDKSCFGVRPRTPPLQPSKPALDFTPPPKDGKKFVSEEGEDSEAVAVAKPKGKRAGAKGDGGPAKKKSKKQKKKKKKKAEEDDDEDDEDDDKENRAPA
jgi:hypothetical protein